MSRMSSDLVEQYLNQYGWAFQRVKTNIWQTGWRTEDTHFPLTLQLTDTWFGFSVQPLLSLGIDWASWPELSKYLLEINADSKLVKIGIDEFGDISLSFELFQLPFSYEDFSDSLGIIGYYGEQIHKLIESRLSEIGYYTCPEVTMVV